MVNYVDLCYSWTSHGDHLLSASACHSCLFVLNYCITCLWFLSSLNLVWDLCLDLNIWFVMCDELLVCATLIYLCSSCGCEVVLTKLNFMSYISCILYASISTCREKLRQKFQIYMCVFDIYANLYAHIKGEFSLLIELGEFIHTIFWNFQENE